MAPDMDFAQYQPISEEVGGIVPPVLDALRRDDGSFRPVPTFDRAAATALVNNRGCRAEFPTTDRGGEKYHDKPAAMPSLGGVRSRPMRFLDSLVRVPVWPVMLHKAGMPVRVPDPARYAVQIMIVSTLSSVDSHAKADKDFLQTCPPVMAPAERRLFELGEAPVIAEKRGPKWKAAICETRKGLDVQARDNLANARTELFALTRPADRSI